MSILKVDKALQQDDDALITTSTKDSDPDNAVVTKDYLKKSLAGFKPQNDLDLDKLDKRYALKNHHHNEKYILRGKPFAPSNKLCLYISSHGSRVYPNGYHEPGGEPYMGIVYVSDTVYKDINGSDIEYLQPISNITRTWTNMANYIERDYIGGDPLMKTLENKTYPDPAKPGVTVNYSKFEYTAIPGSWMMPFATFKDAYEAALIYQQRLGLKLNVEFCFDLEATGALNVKGEDFDLTGHDVMFNTLETVGIDSMSGRTAYGWTHPGNTHRPVIFDARPFNAMLISTFRYKTVDRHPIVTNGPLRSGEEVDFVYDHEYYKNTKVPDSTQPVGEIDETTTTPRNCLKIYSTVNGGDFFTLPSIFIYGTVAIKNKVGLCLVVYSDFDIKNEKNYIVQPVNDDMHITSLEKNNRISCLHIMENSRLSIVDDFDDLVQGVDVSDAEAWLFFLYWHPMYTKIKGAMGPSINRKKYPMLSAVDIGKNAALKGPGKLSLILGLLHEVASPNNILLIRDTSSVACPRRSYLYMDKYSTMDLTRLTISDPYYLMVHKNAGPHIHDFSVITMDTGASLNNQIYFVHYPADLMHKASTGDQAAMDYICKDSFWGSIDSSKLYPSYTSNTKSNKMFDLTHRRVLTWRGPIDFNYDAIHYDIPKEGKDKVLTEHWSRSLAFHRSKDCGATGTIQYPQKTYMWNILHNPHLDTTTQYGNADSMWNIYLPNILGGDICMIETYDDWLYGAKPVQDAWHMYASEIWVDV